MKHSKKYLKRIKKRLLGCMSSITVCIMLIAGSNLAGISMPISINNILPIKLNADETTVGAGIALTRDIDRLANTDTDIYIYDKYDIEIFRNSVNAGNDYAGKTVHLMNDIDLSSICSETVGSWEPIGTYYTSFAGTFDGNYHTISNLYINTDEYQTLGFFKQTGKTAIIKNLLLEGVEITSNYPTPANNTYVGGLVGWHEEGAEIINCGIKSGIIKDEITAVDTNSAYYGPVIGGIAGRANGRIEGCYNKATIQGTAQRSSNSTNVMVAGITGAGRGEITNSYNTGNIIGTSYENYVGGVIGNADNSYTGKVANTYNKGTITYTGTTNYVGGTIGRNGWSADYSAIEYENSYATNSNLNSYYHFNGSTVTTSTSGRITGNELKGYAVTLGEEYVIDLNGINDKDPILYWEAEYPPKAKLNINQTYIEVGEIIDLNVLYSEEIEEIIGHSYTAKDFTWTSTNKDIAEVNGNGRVKGLKDGYTTIYASYKYEAEDGLEKEIYAMGIINVAQNVSTPQVATGNGFTAVLKADGTVWTIGNNEKGQLGNGKTGNKDINEDETVVTPKPITAEQVMLNENTALKNVIKIAVGTDHVLALTKNGQIYAWGSNENEQLAIGASLATAQLKVYATLIKDKDGSSILNNIVDIGTGEKTSVALDKDGNVYEWGNGESTPTKKKVDNIIRISVGKDNISALESNGLLWAWGENGNAQTGSNSTTNYTWPLAVTTKVTEVSSGGRHTVIEKTDNKVYATGNLYGTKEFEEIELPENVTETNPVKYIKAGYDTTTIMLKDGTIYGEGGNVKGALGIGTNTDAPKFAQGLYLTDSTDTASVRPITDAIMIGDSIGDGSTSSLNTTVITENGDVYISGDNTYSQMNDNTKTPSNYYTKMGFIYLDYEDKIIEIDQDSGYQIDLNKLGYKNSSVNVYSNEQGKKLGEIKYTSYNTDTITVGQNGYISAHGKQGVVKVKIEDITNGYDTYITVIAGKLTDTDTVEYIYTIEDLVRFRDSVNAGNDYSGKTVYVMADIDMSPECSEASGISWTPIGATGTYFAGTFEGNYHKLSNLYMNTNNFNIFTGLFTQNNGTIQDLILENVDIYAYKTGVNDEVYVGGIAGENRGNIINCGVNSGSVTAYNVTAITSSWRSIAAVGIAGSNSGKIISCYNKANIKAQTCNSNNTGAYPAGIAGQSYSLIQNCYNTGVINGIDSNCNEGGIVATVRGGSVINSYNIGTVTGTRGNIGGIVGGRPSANITCSNNYWLSGCGATYGIAESKSNSGAVPVASATLQTYATTLGTAYENDDFNINNGYPILWWEAPTIELNKKQAYINITEELQLKLIQNEDISNFLGKDLEMTDFTWTSTNEDVAIVDENGIVMGTSDGYTTIYGTYKENEKINVMCIINVAGEKATPQIETGGNGFTVVLKADGTVWTIGNNEKGELGNGTIGNNDLNYKSATQVKINETTYLTDVIKISAGYYHVLALTKNGEVYAWGDNTNGQLGNGTTENSTYATKVVGEGGSSTLKRIVDISAGGLGSIAVNEFGWVYTWGNGTNGEFGNGGTNSSNTPVKTTISTGISAGIGEGHVAVLGQNGKAYTFGKNNVGQLGINSTANNTVVGKIADGITEISTAGNETIVKNVNGEVYGTGLNTNGQLGIGTNSNATTLTKMTLPDIEMGENDNQDDVGAGLASARQVKYIKAGSTNTTLLLNDGTVWSAGTNTNGELGNGTNTKSNTFVQGMTLVENDKKPLENVLTIGRNTGLNTAVILENGDIYTTGDNTYGQIGDGTKTSTKYYKKMGFVSLDYKDKIVYVDEKGYKLDLSKLRYIFAKINAYSQEEEIEYTLGEIEFTSADTDIATIDENGLIIGKAPTGKVQIKIEDVTNGYDTYITAIVSTNRLENTDTVEYIYNIEDLVKFRDSVNAGNNYEGKTVYVMADIDMSPECSETKGSWTPIGTDTTIFAGTFEGNYHKLSNLYFNSNNFDMYVGLFTQNNGTIQDLILENVNIYAYKTGANDYIYAGGIAERNNGSIINCGINSGSITANSKNTNYVGGICATSLNDSKILNCYNKANITAQASNAEARAGGITANLANGQMENCYNSGTINSIGGGKRVGGLTGTLSLQGASYQANIKNSYNIGNVLASGGGDIGGIVALNGWSTSCKAGTITNTYCGTGSTYSQGSYWNGSKGVPLTSGRVNPTETLKTYAPTLGTAYENDDFNINNGYPILWWEAPTIELNKKQAYIKAEEKLQLNIVQNENLPNAIVGKTNITDFDWISSNSDVATVNENALVTGITDGYTTIYGRHKEYNNVYAMCVVNVSAKENIATPQIETGNGFTAILKADGTVWMTGNPDIISTGTDGTNDTENDTAITLTPGNDITKNILENNNAMPAQVKINENEYLTNVIKISVGPNHVLALTKNGEVYAWGSNEHGQLGIGALSSDISPLTSYAVKVAGEGGASTLKRIVDISAGDTGSVAVNQFGWVFVWGNGSQGEMGNGNTASSNTPVKTVVSTGISAGIGEGHVAVIGQNGKAYTWGKNDAGQLGINSTANNTIVGKIADGITEISTSGNETIVKDVNGEVYGTGLNTNGQLGIGTNSNVTTLTKMTLPTSNENNVKYIKAGTTNTTILLNDGTVWSTGINTNGELGNGTNDNSNTFEQGLTLVENDEKPLENVLTIGRNTGLNTAVILENGRIYITGSNVYLQITNETEENQKYFVPMRYVEIKAPEKIELLSRQKIKLTEEDLVYRKDMFNVYEEDILTIPLIEYAEMEDSSIAKYENGEIEGKIIGKTQIKVEEESTGTIFYIPVRVYELIKGRITTENYIGTHIAKVKLYRRRKREDEYEEEFEDEDEDILVTEIETKEDGSYVIDIDEVGVYDVLITKEGYLNYKVAEIEIKEGPIVELQEYALIAGDVAEDGEIEINDLVDMNRNLGKEVTEENKEEKAIYDLNEDGVINKEDRNILKKNYGKRAEEIQWVNTNAEIEMMNLEIVEDTNTTDVGAPFAGIPETRDTTVPVEQKFILPMTREYRISSEYGTRVHPITGETKTHHGIDIVGEHHTEILSVADGTIIYAGTISGYGNCVEIKHIVNGETIYSFYAHLSRIDVKVGEKVVKGQVIGLEGGAETDPNPGTSTGHHLHFELRTDSGSGNSIDPRNYIEF